MSDVERLPCPLCGEPIASVARLCPHCKNSALVDVAVEETADARRRYQISRAVSGLRAPFAGLAEIQASLAAGGPVAWDVTQAEAQRALEALRGVKASGKTVPAAGRSQVEEPSDDAGASPYRKPALYGLAAAAAVAAWFGMQRAPAPAVETARPTANAPAAVPPAAPLAGSATSPPSRADLARRVLPSIVGIRCANSAGAGFFVAPDLVMTNAHVLCGDSAVSVLFSDGRRASGSPSRSDSRLDLALVQVAGATGPPLELGDAGTLAVGEPVMMIGSPVGFDFSVHQASLSNLSRPLFGVSYLQIEARINPGNSGGPLLDMRGRVVGVVSLKQANADGIGLALPINYAFPGQSGFVQTSAGPSSGFDTMLARASDEDRQVQRTLDTVELKPVVGGVSTDRYRNLVVRVVQPSRGPLGYTDFRFKLLSGRDSVCTMSAGAGDWKPVERKAGSGMDARAGEWLRSLGFDVQIYESSVTLMMSQCGSAVRSGTVLELEGADPRAARITIR